MCTRDDASTGCWSKKARLPFFLHQPFWPMRQSLFSMNISSVRNFRDFSAMLRYSCFFVVSCARYRASGSFEFE